MEFNVKELREKVNYYFSGKMSKEDIGDWANKAYYDLLKGNYVEIEKVVIYPFLKTISTFHLKANDKDDIYPCSEENIKEIRDILNGEKEFDFSVEMSIPIQAYTMFKENSLFDKERHDIFERLRNLVVQDYEREKLGDSIMAQLEIIICLNRTKKTVQEVLEEDILKFLRVIFKINSDKTSEKVTLKLYAQKSKEDMLKKRLVSYLDSYLGNENFHLLVSFRNGLPEIMVVV